MEHLVLELLDPWVVRHHRCLGSTLTELDGLVLAPLAALDSMDPATLLECGAVKLTRLSPGSEHPHGRVTELIPVSLWGDLMQLEKSAIL